MIDLLINNNTFDILFSSDGDLLSLDTENDRRAQDLSILLSIDHGHNKQYPNLGIAYYKSINGNEKELINTILTQSSLANIGVSNVYIDNNQVLQINI